MKKCFFLGVQEVKSAPPLQMICDSEDRKYITNVSMADYAKDYFCNLFTSQGSAEGCDSARNSDWSKIPSKVSPIMNSNLTKPFSKDEVYEALKELPTSRAPGVDGFPAEFFSTFLGAPWDRPYEVLRETLSMVHYIAY